MSARVCCKGVRRCSHLVFRMQRSGFRIPQFVKRTPADICDCMADRALAIPSTVPVGAAALSVG
jgi:hypothetical protein